MIEFNHAIPWDLIARILVGSFLGALLGLERGIHGQAAGLRTHILVSTGSAVFMILSINVANFGVPILPEITRVTDPGRIAAQIVTGIGFLGAGAIIKDGFTIRGLTTAASLWITAAIGMAAGAGFFFIAFITTMIALFSLVVLHNIEKLYPKDVYRELKITVPLETNVSQILALVESHQIKIIHFDLKRDYDQQLMMVEIFLRLIHKSTADSASHTIIEALEKAEIPMRSAEWRHD